MGWSLASQPLYANGETSLRYLDVVAMHKAAIGRIAGNPDAQVLTTWPHTDAMMRPLLGYVQQPIAAKPFREESDLEEADFILVSQPAGRSDRLRELAQGDAWQLILRQVNENAWIELYARAQPLSSPPTR